MHVNFLAVGLAALFPLITGFLWYHPKAFGTTWMRAAKMRQDDLRGSNMALIFGLTFVFSLLMAFVLQFLVIHQWHLYSTLANQPGIKDPNSPVSLYIADFYSKYGNEFRTFKHGAFHGTLMGIMLALPIVSIVSLFERKGWRYILVHAGYFTLTLALMGGIVSAMK